MATRRSTKRKRFIDGLAKKENWTGKEAGIYYVYLKSVIEGMRLTQETAGEQPNVNLKDFELLNKKVEQIRDKEDAAVYFSYATLYDWIILQQQTAETQFQQAQLQYRALSSYIERIVTAEKVLNLLNPVSDFFRTHAGEMPDVAVETMESIKKQLGTISLDSFITSRNKNAHVNCDIIGTAHSLILDSYYYLLGYNKALSLIGSIFEIPEIEVYAENLDELTDLIDDYNSYTPLLQEEVKKFELSSKKEFQSRELVRRTYFHPIRYKSLKIPAANIKKAKAIIEDTQSFVFPLSMGGTAVPLMHLLCDRRQANQEDLKPDAKTNKET